MGWREWEEKGEGNEEKNEVEGGGGEGGRGVGEKEKEKEKERENWAEGELGGRGVEGGKEGEGNGIGEGTCNEKWRQVRREKECTKGNNYVHICSDLYITISLTNLQCSICRDHYSCLCIVHCADVRPGRQHVCSHYCQVVPHHHNGTRGLLWVPPGELQRGCGIIGVGQALECHPRTRGYSGRYRCDNSIEHCVCVCVCVVCVCVCVRVLCVCVCVCVRV